MSPVKIVLVCLVYKSSLVLDRVNGPSIAAAFFHIFLNLNNFHPKIFASFGDDFCPKIRDYVRIVTVFLLFSAPQAKMLSFFRSAIQFRLDFPLFLNIFFLFPNLKIFSSDFQT